MINAGNNVGFSIFDQNRVYIGVEKNLHKNVSIEMGYLYWFQQRSTGYQFFKSDIFRFTLYHKMAWH